MPWQKLPEPTEPLPARKTRILVDESLGRGVADLLKDRGYNAVFAEDVGLKGKDDSAVAAYAWREKRSIWTHDADFLKDSVVPQHSNPGVVVLPGAGDDQNAMVPGLVVATTVFGQGDWAGSKCTINAAGEMTIRSRDARTGVVRSRRYRMTKNDAEIWVD